jgi:hypothetical protein
VWVFRDDGERKRGWMDGVLRIVGWFELVASSLSMWRRVDW